ncbi:MAG: mannose-6-phosphate isomerase, class I [Ilumatobacteraceae bacterium]|nr:mannose-6-phosphate isomerase, class I [Ilumatobacteraceae bacterium]
MKLVRGVLQHYSWGDKQAIPHLLNLEPDGRPWAELWFGTHLGGSSKMLDVDDHASVPHSRGSIDETGGQSTPLISTSGELPFLLKVLAAAEPLSLQAHPSLEQAKNGYARENRLGVPVSNSRRIYRDPFSKPELLCALGPFEAFCGFREPTISVDLLHSIGGGASVLARLLTDHDLDHLLHYIFSGTEEIRILLTDVVEACAQHDSPHAVWVTRLNTRYPNDPAVVASLLLNHVILSAGEALYLDPGNLHAYLSGTGVEVMGSSDNVVRCGLTNKHVDINELLATVIARPLPDPVLRPTPVRRTDTGHLWCYETPHAPFQLSIHQINGTETLRSQTRELILCGVGRTDRLHRGEVCYLGPDEEITLTGKATLFRVDESSSQ